MTPLLTDEELNSELRQGANLIADLANAYGNISRKGPLRRIFQSIEDKANLAKVAPLTDKELAPQNPEA